MNNLLILLLVALLQSCATRTPQTDALVKSRAHLPESHRITTVPFVEQTENHCGPASVAMILRHHQRAAELSELSTQMLTPGKKGTFSTDLVTAVRRQGMVGVEVNDVESLLKEIAAGNPVLVFQNLGFRSYPSWHYAVALGYDLEGPDLFLHSGKEKFKKTDMRFFERSWSLTNFWGLLILPPGKLAASASDLAHVAGISGLEQVGKLEEAKRAYEAVLTRWPRSLPALIGIGNVYYSLKDYRASVGRLRVAAAAHPDSAVVWNNLASAEWAAGDKRSARASAKKALDLAAPLEKSAYHESLRDILVEQP